MRSSIKNIIVDITNSAHSPETVVAVQGDNIAREVHITVLDDGYPYDLSEVYPILRGIKPDGKTVFINCPVVDNKIIITLTSQLLVAEGFSTYEIALYKIDNLDHILDEMGEFDPDRFDYDFFELTGEVVTSFPFKLRVTKSYYKVENLISSDQFKICNDIVGDSVKFERLVNSLPDDYLITVAEVKRLEDQKEDKGVCYTRIEADSIFVTKVQYNIDIENINKRLDGLKKQTDENDIDIGDLQDELNRLRKMLYDLINNDIVYGFTENYLYDINDPKRIEYIETNKDFTPMFSDIADGFSIYGSWDGFQFLTQNKPFMVNPDGTVAYQLPSNEQEVLTDVETNPDWKDDSDSHNKNAMVWIPRIYKYEAYNYDEVSGEIIGRTVKFCFREKEGYKPLGFIDSENRILEGVWIPIFYGCAYETLDESAELPAIRDYKKMRSLIQDDRLPTSVMNMPQMKDSIEKNGERFRFFGGPIMETLFDLMVMFAKSANLIESYGHGNLGAPMSISNKPTNWNQFYGHGSGADEINRVFYSEVLGTHDLFQTDPYMVTINGHLKVSPKYNYDLTGETYVDTGILYKSEPSYSVEDNVSINFLDNPTIIDNFGCVPNDMNKISKQDLTKMVDAYLLKIREQCTLFNNRVNGNVNYVKRPFVLGGEMQHLYPEVINDAIYTLYPLDYTIGDDDNKYIVVITPIMEEVDVLGNKTILSLQQLETYIQSLDYTNGIDGIIASDYNHIVIDVIKGENHEAVEKLKIDLHPIQKQHLEYSMFLSELTGKDLNTISKYIQGTERFPGFDDRFEAPIFLSKFKNIESIGTAVGTRLGWRGYSKELQAKTYEFMSTEYYHPNRGCSIMILPQPGYKPYY